MKQSCDGFSGQRSLGTFFKIFSTIGDGVAGPADVKDVYQCVGVLIALFEPAIVFYLSLINSNAYHQPEVEAGKKAAGVILGIQTDVLRCLSSKSGILLSPVEIASELSLVRREDPIFRILEHLDANDRSRGKELHRPLSVPFASK